ncbi:MAG: alginate export family protein [Dokdonella sp.]
MFARSHTRISRYLQLLGTGIVAIAAHACTHMALAAPASAPVSGAVIDLRYRYESVEDDAFVRSAEANTLRLRLGYRWVFAPGWQLYADGERVQPLFGERYNSTANGMTQYPTIADPETSEINQAYVAYADDALAATLGRQRIQFDNQRFIGNVGWRQNEQTFDALSTRYTFGNGGPTLRYAYLDRVLRVFGHENPNPLLREYDLRGHAINISQPLPSGSLTGYAYLIENQSVATLSTQTIGARWTGAKTFSESTAGWVLEFAHQSDWANNPQAQNANYRLIEPSLSLHGITFKAGWEVLGGNGRYGFSTPYATLHAFNGWADRFLTTPRDGLDDRYLAANGKIGKAAWVVTWHDFHADQGSAHYGSEADLSLGYPVNAHINALLKYADYRSDGFASDERKLWASVEYTY